MPLPTQTWAWLLLWSIKSETGRQSASWLRPSLTHSLLVLNAYSCHTLMDPCPPLCLLHIKIFFIPHTSHLLMQRDLQPHMACSRVQFSFAWGQQSLIGPHLPSQLFSKGSCHSLDCEREGAQKRERRRWWGSAGPWECKHRSPTSRVGIHCYTSTLLFLPVFGKWDWTEFVSRKYIKVDFYQYLYHMILIYFWHLPLGFYLWLYLSQSLISLHLCVYLPRQYCLIRLLLVTRRAMSHLRA